MDDVRLGNTLRVIRIRKRLRQSDVPRRAGVRRETVGRLEHGAVDRYPLATLRAVATALGGHMDVRLRWQGGDLDQVVNAALHESVVRHLASRDGWTWRPEASFSIYGERGVIDILAWHAATRSLLIIELKTELVDPQALASTMDRRARLGPEIVRQWGWTPVTISSWVIVSEGGTNRRPVKRYDGLLRQAFASDGRAMRRWLREPRGSISALSFWSDVRSGPHRRTVGQTRRVRVTHPREPQAWLAPRWTVATADRTATLRLAAPTPTSDQELEGGFRGSARWWQRGGGSRWPSVAAARGGGPRGGGCPRWWRRGGCARR